jgi:hypothetical protein
MGEWRHSSTILKLGISMEVSGQFHAPATLTPGKSPRHPLDRRLGEPQPVWTMWRREKYLALPGIEPRSSRPSLYRLSCPDSKCMSVFSVDPASVWPRVASLRKIVYLLSHASVCFPVLPCKGKTVGPTSKRVCFHSIRGDVWNSEGQTNDVQVSSRTWEP